MGIEQHDEWEFYSINVAEDQRDDGGDIPVAECAWCHEVTEVCDYQDRAEDWDEDEDGYDTCYVRGFYGAACRDCYAINRAPYELKVDGGL